MSRHLPKAAALAALLLAAGMLSACAGDPGALPKVPERCPKPFAVSPEELSTIVDGSAVASAAITIASTAVMTHTNVGDSAGTPLWSSAKDQEQLNKGLAEVAKKTTCGKATLATVGPGVLPMISHLGLAEVSIAMDHSLDGSVPGDLYALNSIEGLKGLRVPDNFNWDLFQERPGVTVLHASLVDDDKGGPALVKAAAKLPGVESLYLDIADIGDWDNANIAKFDKATDVHFRYAGSSTEDGVLKGISTETLDLILGLPKAMSQVKTVNGVSASSLSAAALGIESTQTREAILAERKALKDIEDLGDWRSEIEDGDFKSGASANHVAGPIVIVTTPPTGSSSNSIESGVRGKDWNGVPAAKLCKEVEGCASLIQVGFREGGSYGSYRPVGGGAVAFTGSYGETIVTIYNASGKSIAGPVVAATTQPPDTVSSKSEAVGKPNWTAAYQWINSHLN
jgi:hypothetical protein